MSQPARTAPSVRLPHHARPGSPRPPRRLRAALALAAVLALGAGPAQALDYVWLGQVDTLWFSNNTSVGGVIRSNWQPSAPFNDASTTITVDGLAGRGNRVQVSYMSYLSPSPFCSGSFLCGSVGPRMGSLTLAAGTTAVVGGSSAFGDAWQYANAAARMEWIGAEMGGAGVVHNAGTLRLSSLGNRAMVGVYGTVTLQGSGQTVLDNGFAEGTAEAGQSSRQFFYGGNGGWGDVLVVAAEHTLRGRGSLGVANGNLAVDNHGLIQAESGGQLVLVGLQGISPPRTHSIVNTGTLQATGGARLTVQGTVDNRGGQMVAQAGSVVELVAGVTGGTLRTVDSGVLRVTGGTSVVSIAGARLDGLLEVPQGKWLGLGPGFVNDGTLRLSGTAPGISSSVGATVHVMEDMRIDGSGRIVMAGAGEPPARFTGYSGLIGRAPVLTFGSGQTLSGSALLGGASTSQRTLAFVNEGRIQVEDGQTLQITAATLPGRSDSVGFLNQGQMQVQAGGTLQSLASSLGNDTAGRLVVERGGMLTGTLVQLDGHVTVDGSAQSVQLKGGLLDGTGTITSLSQTGGVFAPGHSPGTVTIEGSYTLNGGDLVLEVDGPDAAQADHLVIGGGLNLYNGRIVVDLSDYRGGAALSFADLLSVGGVLRTQHPTLGTRSSLVVTGLAPGREASLAWTNGQLGLTVAAAPVPEPATWALWAAGLLGLGRLATRRGRR
ncbi:hypothetical protein AACH10_05650 [Ideonella sp. DXS22W]|uniref:PEP-CTERM protein-sorting domain-containing protein n=1 Tax=Pseudaquabacterium inlustre TaxID=2984192 RepID=A0ABU9CFM6_9BURK